MTSFRYAGLQNVHQPGFQVEEAVRRLQKLAYAEERLLLLQAAHLVIVPEWDIKLLLGRTQYEDAEHADQLKQRLTELRISKNKAMRGQDEALSLVFDEAMYSANTVELLAALTQVFKPALLQAYREYMAQTNALADQPTVRLLKLALVEEEEHLTLLQAAFEYALRRQPDLQPAAEAWAGTLAALLSAAGGIDGCDRPDPAALRPVRAAEPYVIPRRLGRDDTFTRIWDFLHVDNMRVDERLAQMIATRLSEITAAEGLGYVLWETKDQPWPFYIDLSRHLWDEIRHTIFGEVATEDVFGDRAAMPMRTFDEASILEMTPLEMYAMLGLGVEASMMKYPPGKREEYEFCRDSARYPLMATFQDFDWADEVLHVNIARRQLKEWFSGSQDELMALAQAGLDHRAGFRHRQPPQPLPSVGHKLSEMQAGE
ncbi:MAG: hypothetical protein FOGNACKC_04020 [Anaerolineae bacterium]|nr:hypothetical protein [Anaerolineae bacterium]